MGVMKRKATESISVRHLRGGAEDIKRGHQDQQIFHTSLRECRFGYKNIEI